MDFLVDSVDLNEPPPWSRSRLRALGKALVTATEPPGGCPTYTDVMLWHNELAANVAAIVYLGEWSSFDHDRMDVTSRPKTLDTLLQKLRRLVRT